MSLATDIQTLSPGTFIELFTLDMSPIPNAPTEMLRFYPGRPGMVNPTIIWRGEEYDPWAIEATGFAVSGQGSLPRPQIKVGNVMGSITTLVLQFQDLLGAIITRHTTLLRFLDAANFPTGVNPDADPSVEFSPDVFLVERKVSEQKDVIAFELAASIDCWGVQLPRRQIIQNTCTSRYKGPECGWVPMGIYYKRDDTPTSNPAEDSCGKRLSSCKCRFGEHEELNYGSFPAAGLLAV